MYIFLISVIWRIKYLNKNVYYNIYTVSKKYRAERHNLKSRFLLFILLFLFPLFLGGMRIGEKNNRCRDFKSCPSAWSYKGMVYKIVISLYLKEWNSYLNEIFKPSFHKFCELNVFLQIQLSSGFDYVSKNNITLSLV